MLAGSIDEHYDILHVISEGFLGLLPLVLVGAILGGLVLNRRALAPVGAMTSQARMLSLTNLHARISNPATGDELQDLAEAWNDMLARLESSAQHITQFTADASHDLRTAITVTLANAELALRRERSPERYQQSLRTIAAEAAHMLAMLDDLLLATGSGWPSNVPDLSYVDVLDLLRDVFNASRAAAQLHQHDLRIEALEQDVYVSANRALLRRLLHTLVDNAIKYTPPGGSIMLRLSRSFNEAHVEIVDNGIGIAQEMQSRIFERLVRIDPARTQDTTRGHGLGLSIAKWVADVHGFSLHVESALHRGSTFRLSSPIASNLETVTKLENSNYSEAANP